MKIGIIGAGSWGTALAILLGNKGFKVDLWVRRAYLAEKIASTGENQEYLSGFALPKTVLPTADPEKAVRGKELVILAVPSHAVGETTAKIKDFLDNNCIIVNTAKGIAEKELKRLSQVIEYELSPEVKARIAVISGPNHAEEVVRGIPTATVVSSRDQQTAEKVQDIFMGANFRVYTNTDLTGVELGGAFKNIIAIGAGICEGIGFGDNTKAALLTRGLVEITRIGVAMGARSNTFSGLTGVGDLFVTCTSTHSRNRYVGLMLGKGNTVTDITSSMKMVAEGIKTAKAAKELSRIYEVEMPISNEVYDILFQGKTPLEGVKSLMRRDKTFEMEDVDF